MATAEEIEASIAAINARLDAGVESVAHGEDSVRYNIAELRRRKAELQAELAVASGTTRIRHIRVYSGKGY